LDKIEEKENSEFWKDKKDFSLLDNYLSFS